MQNKWTIYSFLGIMMVALVTLAVLQYHWLGSVSDAERKRLQENLDASTENFVSDLNRDLSSLNQAFKIQISNNSEAQIEGLLGKSYLNWLSNTEYPQLIDSLFFVQDVYGNEPVINLFSTDPARLTEIDHTKNISDWIRNHSSGKKHGSKSFDLIKSPDFGDPTFIAIPVQLLDLVTIEDNNSGKNMQVSLNIDQGDDVVLLQLNDEVIKSRVIPKIAKTYFSDSFDDQYHISIIKEESEENNPQKVYFTTSETNDIPTPDFKKNLRKLDFTSVFLIQSERDIPDINPLLKRLDSLPGSIRSISINNENSAKGFATNSESSQMRFRSVTKDSVLTIKTDTTINNSFEADFITAGWQFWLSFKEGSLDSFVNKTKNRNLAISFGILVILGFCVGMIVLFSKRSQDLAEQQMLFVAGVSHELRTPITVIRSAAENLNEGIVQDEKKRKQYTNLMLNEGRRLSDMVDQIMEFSGIQAGKRVYNFAEVEIEDLMNEILSEYRPVLESEGIQLEYSFTASKSVITADRDALYLSISNLLSNAIKFSGSSKTIRVAVAETTSQDFITFIVKDTGIGIPLEEQKKVFKPFFRGKKPVDDQVKGNGIGLSLVKKVAEAHKGEIRVKSKEGEGSVFILILPLENND